MPRNIKICNIGYRILEFFLTTSTAIVLGFIFFGLILRIWDFSAATAVWIAGGITIFLAELALFWVGIVMVYFSSLQLGIKTRILGALCGWIPFVNLYYLMKIIKICRAEVAFEKEVVTRDLARKDQQVCKTRYPILLVHGVFFRDSEHLNYWGRVPAELIKNGADIVTDTNMAYTGINKGVLAAFGGEAHCFMADPAVAAEAKERGVTRATVSMEKAAAIAMISPSITEMTA